MQECFVQGLKLSTCPLWHHIHYLAAISHRTIWKSVTEPHLYGGLKFSNTLIVAVVVATWLQNLTVYIRTATNDCFTIDECDFNWLVWVIIAWRIKCQKILKNSRRSIWVLDCWFEEAQNKCLYHFQQNTKTSSVSNWKSRALHHGNVGLGIPFLCRAILVLPFITYRNWIKCVF